MLFLRIFQCHHLSPNIYVCIYIIRKICLKRLDTGRDGDNRDGDNLEKQGKITNKDEIKKNKSLDTPLFDPR